MAESCMGGGCVMFQQADLANSAFPVFEEIRKQGKLCDVTIKVDDKLFSAHRIVLCATIPYFNSMFTIDMVESRQREVEVRGIDPSAMESLIQFAYSGKITIHPGNVNNLMIGAAYLQLNQVRDACADFYKQRLDCKNVLSIQSFAETLSCLDLVKAADRFLEKNFTQVAEEEEFVSIDVSQMQELLNRDSLCVTEEGAFEALIRWVKKDSESRSKHLPNLLAQVRLPLLSPTFLTDRVSKEELIRSCHRCRDLVDEAKDFHLLPERRSMFKSYRCRPRCFADVVRNNSFHPSNFFYCFIDLFIYWFIYLFLLLLHVHIFSQIPVGSFVRCRRIDESRRFFKYCRSYGSRDRQMESSRSNVDTPEQSRSRHPS